MPLSAVPGADGFYAAPELALGAPQDGALVQQEIFGPLLAVQEYGDLDEAIRLADDSPYGLGATIWGADRDAADRVVAGLSTGIGRRDRRARGRPNLAFGTPFEPRKQSGFGIEGGLAGITAFTTWAINHAG